jgi:hypothetical protein
VIRLVTQFDRPSARPAVATPTCCCAGCCCCCSCIVTVAGSSIYTAVNAQSIRRSALQHAPEAVRWESPFPGLLGFFALPLAVLVMALVVGTSPGSGLEILVLGLGVWVGLATLAYWGAGTPQPWARAVFVILLSTFALVVEFFLWLVLIASGA